MSTEEHVARVRNAFAALKADVGSEAKSAALRQVVRTAVQENAGVHGLAWITAQVEEALDGYEAEKDPAKRRRRTTEISVALDAWCRTLEY